ncbi:MAG: IS21-like element helper ATPase IstB [Candidatus Eisenbacteria bacterium]|uniref:IS21-like element helper ATPase IstB n=1 Tax=Eiseniibacteriota bacterium TaxID=2212470 RepID=A0A956SI62_UNCEI|nr:IS21-like element helper ATPase IstB [Candidatus Eisenbacteria bacterium]
MEIKPSLKTVLKRLKLSGVLDTLPDRAAYAKKTSLPLTDFLELILQDEIDRREEKNLSLRLRKATFDDVRSLEDFDWDAPITFDRDRVRDLFSLGFIERAEDVLFLGPVGVGKTLLACCLGHAACRAGRSVLFLRADQLFKELRQAQADHSREKVIRRLLAPDLLVVDDFGLRRLDSSQSSDIYEIVVERHRRASTIFTSNRAVEEWIPLFDDPVLAQSALDRLAHNAHQVVIEGDSYRRKLRPGAPGSEAKEPAVRRKRKRA